MIDTTLIDTLKAIADKEKKLKEYQRRLRIKGKLIAKGRTKKGNITLKIDKEGEDYSFVVIKSHKERYALAEKLQIGRSVSIEGKPKFRMIICTRLKALDKGLMKGNQIRLEKF
ncbi:hypothetical protein HYU12_03810 [Candidatus Woesearchaeota archaeon]|nr:hypothetical protein [Candidatus Woesearchaeota archaeon]